jgi:lipocalin
MMKPILFFGCLLAAHAQDCKEVTTVENFDLQSYASAKWFVHQQAETLYLPKGRNFCVTAEYSILDAPTVWGYTVGVRNSDRNEQGDEREGDLCAYSEAETPSKLAVAPCFLPKIAAGPYWVVAYDEAEGYALVSGGQPTIPGDNGGCKTGRGVNNSGLWIFSRSRQRDEALINKVRALAVDAGFDTSVLEDVDQRNCGQANNVLGGISVLN